MSELAVSEDELRELLVNRLDLLPAAVFDDVTATAKRLRIPLELALAERARVPPRLLPCALLHVGKVDRGKAGQLAAALKGACG